MRGTRGRGTCPAPGGSRRRAHWQTHDAAPAAAWCCGVPVRVAISGSGNPGVTVAIPSCATVTFMIALTIFASVPGPKEPSRVRVTVLRLSTARRPLQARLEFRIAQTIL